MHFNEQFSVGADSVTHCLDQGNGLVFLRALKLGEARAKGIKLERAVSPLHYAPRGLVKFLWSTLHRIPAVGVGFDTLAYRSAEELVHRLAQRLAGNIPTSHFDSGNGRHRYRAHPLVIVAIHALYQGFDIGRVIAENMPGNGLREITRESIRLIDHTHLADTFQSFIGDDAHYRQVAPDCSQNMAFHID